VPRKSPRVAFSEPCPTALRVDPRDFHLAATTTF